MFTRLSPVYKGILLALAGYTSFSAADICAKWLLKTYSLYQVIGTEHGGGALLLLALSPFLGNLRESFRRQDAPVHALRSVLLCGTALILNYCYNRFPLADVYALIFTKPFLAAILAIFLFNEPLSRARATAIIIGFAGVLIAIRPGASFNPLLLLPLASAGLIALLFMSSRWVSSPGILSVSLTPMLGSALMLFPFLALNFKFMPPFDLALFALLVLTGALGIVCASMAFSVAASAAVAPFMYTQIIWAILFGYIIFGDVPDAMMLVGAAIIIGSGLYLVETERRSFSQ